MSRKSLRGTEFERVLALTAASPVVRHERDSGKTWEEIASDRKRANPLSLSPRQLRRVYEGPKRYSFDALKKVVQKLA